MTVRRRPKPEAPIKALLMPGEPDTIDAGYIDRLLDAFEEHRTNHARDVAGWAASADTLDLSPAQIAHIRGVHLDRFLKHTAHDMQDVLLDFMAADDCRRAAVLLLHGDASGYWKATPGQLQHARELCGQKIPEMEAPMTTTTAKAVGPLTWDDLGGNGKPKPALKNRPVKQRPAKRPPLTKAEFAAWEEKIALQFAALRASQRMYQACGNPNSTEAERLDAAIACLDALVAAGERELVHNLCRPAAIRIAAKHGWILKETMQ